MIVTGFLNLVGVLDCTLKGEYFLPILFMAIKKYISTDVVESDILLLLSREATRRARIKLDIENNSAKFWVRQYH